MYECMCADSLIPIQDISSAFNKMVCWGVWKILKKQNPEVFEYTRSREHKRNNTIQECIIFKYKMVFFS